MRLLRQILAKGELAMKPLLELHLRDEPEKPSVPNPLKQEQEGEESRPFVASKRLNRMARKVAHRAAVDAGRSSSGLFSK